MACKRNLLYILLLLQVLFMGTQIEAVTQYILRDIWQQINLLNNLIVELHKIHHFDNIIFYRSTDFLYKPLKNNFLLLRNLDYDEELFYKDMDSVVAKYILSQLHKPLMIFTISPWEYINTTKAIPNLGNILTNNNLAVVVLNDIFNTELKEFVALSLGACLETKIIFFFIVNETNEFLSFVQLEKLRSFFTWCWTKNILNVILLFHRNHIEQTLEDLKFDVYTYTPFPESPRIINLTERSPREYFQSSTHNVLGYKFQTPVIADKPLVFKVLDPLIGSAKITGISGKIYMEYVKHINATFQEQKNVNVNGSFKATMDYIYDLLNAGVIDMSIHPLTALKPNKFFSSYPISNSNSCVIVPVNQLLFSGLYIPRTLSLKMWILLAILFLTFQVAYMFINLGTYGLFKPWLAFSITLKGLLNMPVGNMGRSKTITMNSISFKRKIFVHMLLILTGVIYCQIYIAALSSFLSSTLYPKQIESLEDLVEANLSIMLVDSMFLTYKHLDLIPGNFSKNLIITDADTVSYHLNHLDTRYAYTVYKEEWKVIQYLQRRLSRPRFKIVPKLCIPNVYLNLPMQFKSPFYNSFKHFIMNAQAKGLHIKWSDTIYWQIHKASGVNVSMMENPQYSVQFSLGHLTYILYIYIGGVILASVVFLIEINLNRFGKSLKLYKNKSVV